MDPTPSAIYQIHTVPKAGRDTDESEDAADVWADTWPIRAAVADGATESIFAGSWAETLVEGMKTTEATPTALTEALSEWRTEWEGRVASRTEGMPWYGAAKADEGSHAALLGLDVHPDGRWRAVAVGDCTLIHLHEGRVEAAWPRNRAEDFSNRPSLLSTRTDDAAPSPEGTTGTWEPGDTFLLATDAVAAWLLRTDPTAACEWEPGEFPEAVEAARTNESLPNDDSTLVVLELPGTDD